MAPRRKAGFLSSYKLHDAYLLQPDRKAGRPGLIEGFAPSGEPVLVREWPRNSKDNDADLEHIWRHELRQLHRLAGYPGAADCIAHLFDAGEDANGFYLVVAPGQRQPLQALLDRSNASHWLKQARVTRDRARIWENLKLLCTGLETLHAQGLLHRNLDGWAVLTAGGADPDFQLTGFEWTMRLSSGERPQGALAATKGKQRDSFARDWLAFGLLAADLLGVDRARLLNPAIVPFELADHVSVSEAKLLRTLVQLIPLPALNGETVADRIDEVGRELAATLANRQPKLILALRLGRGSKLSDRIRDASGFDIEADDIAAQVAFVADDLGEAPLLIGARQKNSAELSLMMRGRSLTYRLQEFRTGPNTSWEIAYSEAEAVAPAPINLAGQVELQPAAIDVITLQEAHARFPRVRGRVQAWDSLAAAFETGPAHTTPEDRAHRALVLLQLIEALYAAADVFPVELVQLPFSTGEQDSDEHRLLVRPRQDPERQALAKALGLLPPQQRFAKALDGDSASADSWIYTEARRFGERDANDTEWQFDRVIESEGQAPAYAFRGPAPPPPLKDAAIYATSAGRDVQFKRRLKALKALREHRELLSMMADPRRRIMESHDKAPDDSALASLDESKQEAFRKIVSTLPLFLVQGPPGVGKTRLVRELVQRRFLEEPTARLLLTAQSNFAVDHLMDELAPLIGAGGTDEALVVRSSKKDSIEAPTSFDIRLQTRQLAQRIATSPLAERTPPKLREALLQMASAPDGAAGATSITPAGQGAGQANRVFEGLVARAANVVFATTNSGELERLIDERGQFDWVIVEEAAKATGSELTSPMLLSHRRLMIGDHLQLPPFASQQFEALLSRPDKVAEALSLGEEFIGRSIRDPGTEDLLDEISDNADELPGLCSEALRLLTYFRSTIETELNRISKGRPGRPIAQRLTAQHRMHPAIAGLVSRCFYGDLTTHPDCARRFASEPPPYTTASIIALPPQPIVVIDIPYVQSSVGQNHGDQQPLWHNPSEVNAALHALSLLRRNPMSKRPPSLAVLSPYGRQVRQLDLAIKSARSDRLANLNEFSPASLDGQLCHTVDSFQGNEADVVVLSLVRNNQHSGVRALGFLSNPQRMNVALSRARWKLVIITSIEFLSEIVASAKDSEQKGQVPFLRDMLSELKEGERNGTVARVTLDALLRETA